MFILYISTIKVYYLIRLCALNEIVIKNGSSCAKCVDFSWPDISTATSCIAITPTHFKWSGSVSSNIHIFYINSKQ